MPVKGAGTTLWVYKGNGDPYANPPSDVDWSRLAKVKDLTTGEPTAEASAEMYPDSEDTDWTADGERRDTAGDHSCRMGWTALQEGEERRGGGGGGGGGG
ncbi:phage tail tube protein, partial [Escherichia coli]|uniref:phage tail tube protein n=1 Tax=Escherichia coli TaxID=562 RepID=UPI0024E0BC54